MYVALLSLSSSKLGDNRPFSIGRVWAFELHRQQIRQEACSADGRNFQCLRRRLHIDHGHSSGCFGRVRTFAMASLPGNGGG